MGHKWVLHPKTWVRAPIRSFLHGPSGLLSTHTSRPLYRLQTEDYRVPHYQPPGGPHRRHVVPRTPQHFQGRPGFPAQQRAPKLQKSAGERLGFQGPWLPWSLPYMVWSGLHERVITLRGLREHTVRLQSPLAEWSLHFYYRMLDSPILCCKHAAWSLGGLSSPG